MARASAADEYGGGGTVNISGGTITATGGTSGGAGIGGGYYGSGGSVIINGGSVKATGSSGGQDIGHGLHGTDSGTLMNKPSGEGGVNVFLTMITLNGVTDQTAVTAITTSAENYGINDVFTDNSGQSVFVHTCRQRVPSPRRPLPTHTQATPLQGQALLILSLNPLWPKGRSSLEPAMGTYSGATRMKQTGTISRLSPISQERKAQRVM